ncbi:hypothetical protein [Nitrobacter sp.]|uniref:hypothetical protein n=1 Tax=Nitrobacter sp. TaxID=29420 RepID=UPI0029CAB8C4|nr:hypothetical protein [Nitrobacter sp.]
MIVAIVMAAAWLLFSFLRQLFSIFGGRSGTTHLEKPVINKPTVTVDVTVKIIQLPDGVREAIHQALVNGDEPDEEWRYRDEAYNGRWECRYVAVRGESFTNSDGVPRQAIIEQASLGADVLLISEPTNAYDPDATAVYVDMADGSAGQIGYLPKGMRLGDSRKGGIAVWLAKKRRSGSGMLGAVLYMIIEESPMEVLRSAPSQSEEIFGYCPGCRKLRLSSAGSCLYCGSTEPVSAT